MLDSSSDSVADSPKHSVYSDLAVSQRRHCLTRGSRKATAKTRVSKAVAFPTRVDLAHGSASPVVCPRQEFFERKYWIDRCLGGILLVLFSPVIVALYLLVRMTSRGPGIYKQERVGLNGQTFEIFKLRSMVQNAEKPGQPQWATKGDARVNLVGRVLRKLHLDELPQLYNVCCGDMSLVGPRPERPQICERLAGQIANYYDRTTVKPGVTGLAQINLPPDESVDDVRRKQILDLHYIENATLWLDARMIVATALRMFGVKGNAATGLMRLNRTYLVRDVPVQSSVAETPVVSVNPARIVLRSAAAIEPRGSFSPSRSRSTVASSDEPSYCSLPNHPR